MIQLAKSAIDVGVVVRDSKAAVAFYRDALGLELVATVPLPTMLAAGRMYRFQCGDTVIKLVELDETPAESNPSTGMFGSTGVRYLTVTIQGLVETVAELEERGARITVAPIEVRPGLLLAVIEDPDGNLIELIEVS